MIKFAPLTAALFVIVAVLATSKIAAEEDREFVDVPEVPCYCPGGFGQCGDFGAGTQNACMCWCNQQVRKLNLTGGTCDFYPPGMGGTPPAACYLCPPIARKSLVETKPELAQRKVVTSKMDEVPEDTPGPFLSRYSICENGRDMNGDCNAAPDSESACKQWAAKTANLGCIGNWTGSFEPADPPYNPAHCEITLCLCDPCNNLNCPP